MDYKDIINITRKLKNFAKGCYAVSENCSEELVLMALEKASTKLPKEKLAEPKVLFAYVKTYVENNYLDLTNKLKKIDVEIDDKISNFLEEEIINPDFLNELFLEVDFTKIEQDIITLLNNGYKRDEINQKLGIKYDCLCKRIRKIREKIKKSDFYFPK